MCQPISGRDTSESVFRQRFDDLPAEKTHTALRQLNTRLLQGRTFGCLNVEGTQLVPVDIDVSVLDNSGSSKQGVSYTYQGHDGYAPIFAHIGAEGYLLDCQLRPGKQHSQSETPEFIERSVARFKELGLDGQGLFRLDSAYDAAENLNRFGTNGFIIKRNPRRESLEQWLALARRVGQRQESRDGKNVYVGFVDPRHPGGDESRPGVPIVYEGIERLTTSHGPALLLPEMEVNTWWTNLSCRAETVIDLDPQHGTREPFYSELQSDLDVERLPSGKLCANKIILLCAMISFNLLRALGQEVLDRAELAPQKIAVSRWRIKTALQNILYCAVQLVKHAGGIELHFGKRGPWYKVIRDIALAYG